MFIHASAKFEGSEFGFHNKIELNLPEEKVPDFQKKITNLAIGKFREKCENYFKIDFNKMTFFEIYYFYKGKEIHVLKKEKK